MEVYEAVCHQPHPILICGDRNTLHYNPRYSLSRDYLATRAYLDVHPTWYWMITYLSDPILCYCCYCYADLCFAMQCCAILIPIPILIPIVSFPSCPVPSYPTPSSPIPIPIPNPIFSFPFLFFPFLSVYVIY